MMPRKKPIINRAPIAVSNPLFFIPIMLLFFLFLLFFFFFHHLSNPTSTAADPIPLQIKQACQSTLFLSLCISSLNSSTSSQSLPQTPTDLILLSISVSSTNLQTAISLSLSIASSSQSNPARLNAARNCISHLSFSALRLHSSSLLLQDPSPSPSSLHNSRALLSAALLYQYDCWSALKYVNSTHQVSGTMSFVSTLTHLTSNALAMLASLQRYGGRDLSLWSPPQTERQGYWPPVMNPSEGGADDDDHAFLFAPSEEDLSTDVTVCKVGGGCDYGTVQDAVNATPDHSPTRFVIKILAGVYDEIVRVPYEKTNVAFVGDGMGKTIITGDLNAKMSGLTTYNTATISVGGDGFVARDLTIRNAAGPGAHQAVAFLSDSDRSVLHSVELLGHQDTLYARSMRQLYHSCRISGTVDFIFGNSAAVFYNCSILVVPRLEGPEKGESNVVAAHGRSDPGQATGFVFKNCTVSGSAEYLEIYKKRPRRHKVYLGRPWKEYSRTVFLNSYLDEMLMPEGWMPWRGDFALDTLFYGEFGSMGPGMNETGRVAWSCQIPVEHLGVYSVRNFIQGDEWLINGLKKGRLH